MVSRIRSLRRRALVVSVLLFGQAAPVRAADPAIAPIEAESRITGVVVYEHSAIVTREATVELGAGVQSVRFAGLPDSVNPNLLQVSAAGTAKATILDVISYATQLGVPANVRLREIKEQQRALTLEQGAVADQIALLKQQRDYLERIKTLTTTHPSGDAVPLPGPEQAWRATSSVLASHRASRPRPRPSPSRNRRRRVRPTPLSRRASVPPPSRSPTWSMSRPTMGRENTRSGPRRLRG